MSLPHNPEAESAVLGSIMIDNSCYERVSEILSRDDFYDDRNKFVFRAIEYLHKKGQGIDVLTVTDTLKNVKHLDTVGGAAYVATLTNEVMTSTNAKSYAQIVAEASVKRKILRAAGKMGDLSTSDATLEEILAKVKDEVHSVNQIGGKQNKYQVASMLDSIDEAKERFENWGKMQGLSSGFPSIDKLTMGLVGGELIIVAGETSRGKTLLSMNIANKIAVKGGRVLFVTLEMTHAELTSRYMYVNDGFDTEDFLTVAAHTVFQKNDELDWKDIDGLIANAKKELDVDLVVVDHLHYFTRELKNVADDLGRITKEFKKNAIRHNIPVILISHVRKMGEKEDLNENALRGSSLIGQDADIVLFVNRDPETNQMGVLITKNRNRGKLSDRTKDWGGRSKKEIDMILLNFNETKLEDPAEVYKSIVDVFPEAQQVKLLK